MVRLQKCNEQNTKFKKHRYLQQRINGFRLNQKESLETLNQAKHTLDELLSSINKNHDTINNPFKTDKIKREVGEWVDVLEGCGQWM